MCGWLSFVGMQGLPRKFSNRYMPKSNREVTLVDDNWNAWFCSWHAGYNYISGRGWRNFALEHCLEEDDALLMEVLEESDTSLTILAHIFRVVPIPDGLTGYESHVCPSPSTYREANTGIRIAPIYPSYKMKPRPQRTRKQAHGKRAKKGIMDSSEDSFTTSESESEELD